MAATEIRHPIGHGGTGDVYRAWDTDLQREVAVKVLREVEGLERFEREAELLSKVDSENVVRIQDFRLHGAHPYIVMELLRGVSLRDCLAESGAMSIAEAVGVVLGVCRGVAACHRLGIIHRDLKPANVFLATTTHRTVAKVLDFGLAKPRSCDVDTTAPGQIPGTPAYMAPELLRGLAADELSDQYSVGLLLYLALTGKRPFGDKQKAELALAIMRSELVPPKEARPDLPEDLVAVLLRAVSGERAARFPSIMALGRALVPFASVEERGLSLELFDEGMGPEDASDVTTAIGRVAPPTAGAATVVAPIGQMAELARRSVELPDVPAEGDRGTPLAGWSGRVVAVVAPMEEDNRRGLIDLPYLPSDGGVDSSVVLGRREPTLTHVGGAIGMGKGKVSPISPSRKADAALPVLLAATAVLLVIWFAIFLTSPRLGTVRIELPERGQAVWGEDLRGKPEGGGRRVGRAPTSASTAGSVAVPKAREGAHGVTVGRVEDRAAVEISHGKPERRGGGLAKGFRSPRLTRRRARAREAGNVVEGVSNQGRRGHSYERPNAHRQGSEGLDDEKAALPW